MKFSLRLLMTLCLLALIAERVRAQEFDTSDLFEDEEDDEPEKEPITKRQFNAVRDTIRNTWQSSIRFLSGGRIIRGLTQAMAALRPSNAASAVASTAQTATQAAGSGNAIGNVFRGMRTAWSRRNAQQQGQFRKRLADITKRLTNNRIIIGGFGNLHKLSSREGKEEKADAKSAEVKTEVKTETKFVPVIPQFFPVPVMPYPHQHFPGHFY